MSLIAEIPIGRLDYGSPKKVLGLLKHLKECEDGLCRPGIFFVELPYITRWLVVVFAGFRLQRGDYLDVALSALIFVLMTMMATFCGRLITVLHTMAERKNAKKELGKIVENMLKQMGGAAGPVQELPDGSGFAIGYKGAREPEDPVEKILRESREEYERNAKKKLPPS